MLKHILDGGFIMLPLLGLSVLAVAVIIDRLRALRAAERDNAESKEELKSLITRKKFKETLDHCRFSQGPIAAVLAVGLERFLNMKQAKKDGTELEGAVDKAMSDFAPHVIESLEKRLNLLTMVGGVSPLLGMTGTVTGMIASFATMSQGLDQAAVSVGISEALVTTASGLIIAIPAVVAYNIFSKRVDRLVLEIEEFSNILLDHIPSRK